MARSLTDRQREVLGWSANGWPDGETGKRPNRDIAERLASRGLVKTSGRGKSWSAELDEAGKKLLADEERQEREIQRSEPRARELMASIIESGGRRVLPLGEFAAIAEALRRLAPDGSVLWTLRSPENVVVRLEPDTFSVPRGNSRLNQVAQRFLDEPPSFNVSRASLRRCARIVHALAREAKRRKYTIVNVPTSEGRSPTGAHPGHLIVRIEGRQYRLKFTEKGVHSAESWRDEPTMGSYDDGATGILKLTLTTDPVLDYRDWSDSPNKKLEEKLPSVLRTVELWTLEADAKSAR